MGVHQIIDGTRKHLPARFKPLSKAEIDAFDAVRSGQNVSSAARDNGLDRRALLAKIENRVGGVEALWMFETQQEMTTHLMRLETVLPNLRQCIRCKGAMAGRDRSKRLCEGCAEEIAAYHDGHV